MGFAPPPIQPACMPVRTTSFVGFCFVFVVFVAFLLVVFMGEGLAAASRRRMSPEWGHAGLAPTSRRDLFGGEGTLNVTRVPSPA